jgi:molybdopterin synthase catalytic subunit
VHPDYEKIEQLRQEYLQRQGIFEIVIEAREGRLEPGDDLLLIIVAGDLRENIKPVLAELLDRIKAEAVTKQEIAPA